VRNDLHYVLQPDTFSKGYAYTTASSHAGSTSTGTALKE
jgi:hypothetical protein